MKKVREFYGLTQEGSSIESGGVGPFCDLAGAVQWLENSGRAVGSMEVYRCEVWEDGSKDWQIVELTT